jgi:hypothetical protein
MAGRETEAESFPTHYPISSILVAEDWTAYHILRLCAAAALTREEPFATRSFSRFSSSVQSIVLTFMFFLAA